MTRLCRRLWRRFRYPTGLHPWRWRFLTVWVIGFSLLVGYAVQQGWQAHRDLCSVRANTQAQIESSNQYLADVKAGRREPIQGITENDIKSNLKRQTAFVAAIHC